MYDKFAATEYLSIPLRDEKNREIEKKNIKQQMAWKKNTHGTCFSNWIR